eukprot:CAMPEP_0201689348 /NCGR_PEP_ID=MMETSP0578-20130828/2963_1 /ASSEMBLY_ACC=CAM_ASM_000663 /TAXON_ID=267565 /ORGANISM="Skeletonema grethea, Strain CCMP 1804" /LENGTH=314 /DNA_ID=CAMNT_0048173971 /DNA_START=1 /DNA_END=945 /DNA_ORIENTATION=-
MVGFVIFTLLKFEPMATNCTHHLQEIARNSVQTHNNVSDLTQFTSCGDAVLDNFDKQFDQKRLERVKVMSSRLGDRVSFDIYEPEATCFSEERFGSDVRYRAFGDGPKFICGVDFIAHQVAHNGKKCLVYSVGSANQIDFEKSVHTFLSGCETHTFDPTLNSAFVGEEYATFHPWGLGEDGVVANKRRKSWEGKSFETVFRRLGHENRTIDVLKIDCEGCEYDVMPPLFELISSGRVQVDQLLIELHLGQIKGNATKLKDFFSGADKAKLRVFHKERNGWGCGGTSCAEYAFASESFLREANRDSICPKNISSV